MKRSLVLRVAIVMFCIASAAQTARAAIVAYGNVEPADPTTWDSDTYGYIGKTAAGTVTVDSNSDLPSRYGYIGYNSGVTGVVTVAGTGSTWTNSGSLYIGREGNGTLNISGGGAVSNSYGHIGYLSGSTGVVTVAGTGSTWTNSGSLYIGREGNGTLNISGGGAVSNSIGHIGYLSGSTGVVTVAGTGSTWNNTGYLYVGFYGSGTLNISGGGAVSNSYGYIGLYSGSTGTVTVDGTGSTWTNSNGLYVGFSGSGTLNITDGGTVSNGYNGGYIGRESGSTGVVTVVGTGSTWTNSYDLYVGRYGSGTLNISGGGAVSNDGIGYIGRYSGSTGVVTIDGASQFSAPTLYVGYEGIGSCTQSGGTNTVSDNFYLGYNSGSSGTYNLNGGILILKSLSKGSGTATFNFGGGTLQASDNFTTTLPMTLTGTGGNANVDTTGYAVTLSGQLSGTGGLNKLGTGTLTLTGSNNYAGQTILDGGTLELGINAHSPILTGGGIDIQGSKLIFEYTDTSDNPSATIKSLLATSYNSGGWDVGQFQSSTATAVKGLGWKDDDTATEVIVQPALYGDATLDGTVNADDLIRLLTAYNQSDKVWNEGDSNYDGTVNADDLIKLLTNYNQSLGLVGGGMGQGITAIPEPSSLVMLATLSILLGLWAARRSAGSR